MPAEAPNFSAIREKLQDHFGKRACLWQLKVTDAFLQNDCDIICMAGTGMGKTLAFWSLLALKDMGVLIIVTPLNQLGKQSVNFLEKASIQSISISAETASRANFRVNKRLSSVSYNHLIIVFTTGHRRLALQCDYNQPRTTYETRWRIRDTVAKC